MVSFPNGKINIGLQIKEKRDDGYYNLETIFYPIKICDVVEILELPVDATSTLQTTGLNIDVSPEKNICTKALALIRKNFPQVPPCTIHLHKHIPMGAGLGGGSADASFVLKMLVEKFQLPVSRQQLIEYALSLGSDCPFFLENIPAYASGRGELLESADVDLSAYRIFIVNPAIHVNTKEAFQKPDERRMELHVNLKQTIKKPVSEWQGKIVNDFEKTVFKLFPEIENIKRDLLSQGAVYAAMSGTGSTVYGIFPKNFFKKLSFAPHYFCQWV